MHKLSLWSTVLLAACTSCGSTPEQVRWQSFGPQLFEQARAEQRLVLLHLGTGWCHWCHVMHSTTYADAEVRAEVSRHFITAREDADARLDLAARYQDYGWPATIVFDGNGRELWKNRGYVPPGPMLLRLSQLAADPQPIAAETSSGGPGPGLLTDALRQSLGERQEAWYDDQLGGWGSVHKYLDADALDWLLRAALQGDEQARARVQQTLKAERQLIDPVWGGAYQYSHGGVWDHPHFEKIMSRQFADLRAFSLAYAAFGDAEHLDAARAIHRYLRDFLRGQQAAFAASQDADVVRGEHAGEYFALDDAARRARGMPLIDQNRYARENGQAIAGLCHLYAVTGDTAILGEAVQAAEWVLANRALPGGGFAHGEGRETSGPFLADTLAMGKAMLQLHEVTGERRWLEHARNAATFLTARFTLPPGQGLRAAAGDAVLPAAVDRDENVAVARFANLLWHYTGDDAVLNLRQAAMAYVSREDVASRRGMCADLLLLDAELRRDPQHVTIVGGRQDVRARELFRMALASAAPYRRLEWFDAKEGPPARADVAFPAGNDPAAFVCDNGACSAPIEDVAALRQRLVGRN